jgi:hypothetical protein
MKITQQFHKIEISNQAHKIHVKQNLLSDNYNLFELENEIKLKICDTTAKNIEFTLIFDFLGNF